MRLTRLRLRLTLKNILLLASLGTLVNGCKVARTYSTPKSMADSLLFRKTGMPDTTTLASMSWKDLFVDSSLQNLIQEGINNNLDLKIASARIKTAQANAKQSRLALLPSLDANASAAFQRVPATQFGYPAAYQLYLNSSWELDLWGKLASAKRAALAALLQSYAYQRAVQTQLVSDIASNYYLLMDYDAQLQITEQTVENRKKEAEAIKLLKESDVVTGAAVVQSEANYYSVKVTIPDLKQNIRETENTLSLLLGRDADTVLRSSLEKQAVTSNLTTGVPMQLLANRPDVQEAELQLRTSFELVNVARAYFYPSLVISAQAGLAGITPAQLFDPASFFANIAGGLLQPIFEKGVNDQRLAVAKAAQEENLATFRKTLLTAGQEVSNALYSYQAAKEKEAMRTEQIAYLQKSVDYTKELLRYSSATNYTDVLTSEQSLLAAQLNGINDKLQQLTAVVSLYRSLGGGWK
jgi:outer membrane protein, multidrug efflux system